MLFGYFAAQCLDGLFEAGVDCGEAFERLLVFFLIGLGLGLSLFQQLLLLLPLLLEPLQPFDLFGPFCPLLHQRLIVCGQLFEGHLQPIQLALFLIKLGRLECVALLGQLLDDGFGCFHDAFCLVFLIFGFLYGLGKCRHPLFGGGLLSLQRVE